VGTHWEPGKYHTHPPTLDENTLGNTWGSKFIQFCAIAKVEVKLDYKPDVAKVFPKIRISSIFLAHLLELLIEIWLFLEFSIKHSFVYRLKSYFPG
jgi:hypothetical protein